MDPSRKTLQGCKGHSLVLQSYHISSRAAKERELGLIKLVCLLAATVTLHWRKYKVVRIQNPFPGRGRVGGRNCLFIHGTFRMGCERCLFLPLLGNPMKNSLQQASCTAHIPYASMKATAAPIYTPLTYSPYLSTLLLCLHPLQWLCRASCTLPGLTFSGLPHGVPGCQVSPRAAHGVAPIAAQPWLLS